MPRQHTGPQELGLVWEGGGFLWDWHNWNAISCHRAYSEVYYEFTGKALKFKWSLAEISFFFFFLISRETLASAYKIAIEEKKKSESSGMWWGVNPPKPNLPPKQFTFFI